MMFYLQTLTQRTKWLRTAAIIGLFSFLSMGSFAQLATLNEDFDNVPALTGAGWSIQNLSNPVGSFSWQQGNLSTFPAHSTAGYIAVNYLATDTTPNATISAWLITPELQLSSGDVFTFWTRNELPAWVDRLQVRLSANGASTNVGATESSVGDFSLLLTEINPLQTVGTYPSVYTQYSVTIPSSVCGATGRIAFRYYITDVNNGVDNFADYIGIDEFRFNHTNTAPELAATITNATCNGYPNGTVTTSLTDGVGPFSYNWSPNVSTSSSAIGLTAGTYDVVITDGNGCKDTVSAVVTQPTAFNVTSSQTNVSCNGGANGTATVSVSGGTLPYSYDWSPGTPSGDGTNSVSGLSAGGYSVTITDSNNCQTTQLFAIAEPAVLVASFGSQNNVSCNGANNGSATVSVTGGTPGYSYSWSPNVGTGATVNNLAPGSYTVTVTDLRGCSDTSVFVITQPASLALSASGQTNIACFGAATGSATVGVSGGSSPYTYLWSDGQSTATATGLAAGVHTVYVNDVNGCSDSLKFTLTEPATPVSLTALSKTDIPCPGGVSGAASVNVATGGTPGYTYDWTPGSPLGDGTTSISNLSAGNYSCVATDANGCSDTVSFVITDIDTVQPNAVAQNFTAYLSSLGSVSVSPSQVNNGSSDSCGIASLQLTPNFFTCANIGANNVELIVTDNNGNIDTAYAVITVVDDEAPVITAPANVSFNTTTGFCSGTGALGAASATDNCSYVITNNAPGTFPVGNTTVLWFATDPSGNQDTASQVVTVVDTESPTVVTQNITAQLDNSGNASITASQVDNGSFDPCGVDSIWVSPTTFTCANVGANTVTLSVRDNNGNVATGTATVTVADTIPPTVITQNVIAYLDASGNATVSATDVDNGSLDNCSIATRVVSPSTFTCANVGSNTVSLVVTDVNGNVDSAMATVTVIDTIAPAAIAQNITVQLDSTGNVTVSALSVDNGSNDACGIASYTINPSTFTCANVGANTVTFTVTDNNGNIDSASATITVQDVTLPSITCPSNVTVGNDAGFCSASSVSLGSPIATDACGIFSTMNDGLATYPVGTTTVTWTTTDVNGNTNTCAQTVTVNDVEAPVIACQNDTVICGSQVVNFATPTFTDNCGLNAVPFALSQSVSSVITNFNSVSCNIGGPNFYHRENSYWRVYDMSSLGTGAAITINEVSFGVESALGSSGTQPVDIRLYTLSGPFNTANLTQVANQSISLADQTGTIVSTLLSAPPTVPANSVVVVEIHTPDGQPVGNKFFLGSNSLGQTAPSYISAPVCGLAQPGNLSLIGFAGMHSIINISGTAGFPVLTQTAGLPSGSVYPVGNTVNKFVVTDAAGNQDSCAFTVTINPVPTTTVSNQELCHNSMTAATTFGGVDTVYTWTNDNTTIGLAASGTGEIPAFTATNTGLTPTIATITVTPSYTNAGTTCTGTPVTFTYTVNPNPSATTSSTDVTCFGFANGTGMVIASGGTPGYTYAWSSGGTASTEVGLVAGTYYITVTDTNGCTAMDSVLIAQPAALVNTPSQTNVSCFAGSDGSATASIAGGTAPYTYSWAPYGGTAATATGLVAGTYTVTVTDSNGCILTDTYTITQPTLIAIVPTSNNVSCNGGNDGTASVVVSGGTPGYSYSWSPVAGNTPALAGLTAGTYTLTVTDTLGCVATQSFTITEPAPLAASMSFTQPSCNGGANATATAGVSGGTGPYAYLWNNGQTSSSISGLTAGTYTVEIIDAKGCILNDTVIVTEPTPLVAGFGSQTNVSCFGGSDGMATVSASGATTPYSYAWTSGGSAATETGLSAGTYTVLVTDANGCQDSLAFTITEPTLLLLSTSVTSNYNGQDISCNGAADGAAQVAATGGTAPYAYLWSDGQTTATATGLAAGTYYVTVTDSLGCTRQDSIILTQPAILSASSAGQTNVSCFGGSNGTATVSAVGGTTPYAYLWSDGQTAATATGLSAGTYSVTVTDTNGCFTTQGFTITEPPLLVASFDSQTNLLCYGDTNGIATVAVTGGVAPYAYSWTSGGTAATETGLAAGTYTVTVTDFNSCTDTLSFTITEPTQLSLSMVQDPVSCFGGNDGSAGVIATGATPGYTYVWSTGETTAAITNLFAGTYSVTVTDNNGCVAVDSIAVTQPTSFNVTGFSTNVSCNGGADGTASVSVSGATPPYQYNWAPGGQTTASVSGLTAGTYTVTITDTNGCSTTQSYTITEPTPLVITPSQSNVSCFGGNNGSASIAVSGGTAPYVYSWSTGATGTSISGLTAGSYSVTVKDINNCSTTYMFTITEPTQLVASLGAQSNVSCNGGTDGSLTVAVTGGTPAYTYLWSTGGTNATVSSLSAGTYSVMVWDANLCMDSISFTVTEPTALTASATQTQMDCAGNVNGQATVTTSGGTPGYSYLWSDGQTAATAVGLSAGSYSVDVTDTNGCTFNTSVSISEYPVYSGIIQHSEICDGDSIVFGGTAYYTAGTYPFTFQTVNGCDSTVSLELIVHPVYSGGVETATICQGTVYPFGGTNYTTAGIYQHTFSTVYGCDSTVTLFLFVNPASYPVFNVTACDSYVFDNVTYNTSGTHVFNHTNIYGCDSIVTLNLTINQSYATTQNSAICQGDTISFGNTIYTLAGSYTHVFQSAQGCDSVVTMNLTVNPVYAGGVQTNVICQGDSVVFGGTAYNSSGSYTYTFASVSGCDSTVTLNLTVNPVYAGGVEVQAICAGQSYTFGGVAYNATGMYPHTFQTVNGCDSTVTLDLTVNPVYAGGIEQTTICQGSTYTFNGTVYSTAGFYTETFQTVNGCDSTVTLYLTVNPLSVSSFTVSACDSYVFNGTTYNASGVYTQSYTNVFGCDSTVTLNLTVKPSYTGGVQNESICQGSSFTFGGNVYAATGSYTHTFNAVNGCDSTVTLNLTVNPTYTGGTETVAICAGDFYAFGGTNYTTAGTYPHTFQSVNGCDSVVTLNLTVNPVYAGGVQNESICQGGSFVFGGNTYTAAGSYTHTFATVNGCDSTVTLNLTVNPVYAGGIQNTTICQGTGYVFGGITYTASGNYTHTFQTVNGCDSTVTLALTVKPNSSVAFNITACDSYTFNGQVYTSTGTYVQAYTNVFGCDSTVTLNLTVNPSFAGGVQNETICQGSFINFGGSVYGTSGSYTHTFQSVGGCDSTVTLNLTVNPSYSGGVQTEIVCQGQTVTFGGTTYNTTGFYTHTFQTVNGCDSTVTLALTVNPTYAGGVQNETICQGGSVLFGGTMYSATGLYTHTFQTVNGCDSTVTLNLLVNPTYTGVQNSVICEGSSISFGGSLFTDAGSYTHVFQTVNGCDSTVTMNLSVNPVYATNLTAVACESYTLNGQTYTASGTYTQLFANTSGCDSVVTLQLVINEPTFATITETACASYTINGETYTQSGTYTQSFINHVGCDSTLTLVLTINHVDVGVTANGTTLTADAAGATYQWINCATGMPIMGETGQSLNVKVNGSYAVIVNDGICVDTSSCVDVHTVGINDVTIVDMNVFPNPNEGAFTIQLSEVYPEINVELYDMSGKLIMRRQFYHTDVMYISEALASGVYQVRVNTGKATTVKTIIRK